MVMLVTDFSTYQEFIVKTAIALTFMGILLSSTTLLALDHPNVPDAPTVYPPGELGRIVKLGEDIINNTNTNPLTKEFVSNDLQCKSCHLQGGKTKTLGTFIGTAPSFPAYSTREKTVQTLQDRINNCYMRSMNGKRPIIDTEASIAMATYITWLSEGLPIKMNPKKPVGTYYTDIWPMKKRFEPMIKKATHTNYLNGAKLYKAKCATCHAVDGQGIASFPPVWGSKSFNTGAGLSKPVKMAAWMKYNMPFGNANLTDEEVVDITLYVDAQPRDDFDLKTRLLSPEIMGHYNSKVLDEKHSVRSNYKALGLDIDMIRKDDLIK